MPIYEQVLHPPPWLGEQGHPTCSLTHFTPIVQAFPPPFPFQMEQLLALPLHPRLLLTITADLPNQHSVQT